MKKFIYLCGMMLLSMNMMAQIDLNDSTWKNRLHEDFTLSGRTWNSSTFISSDQLWRAYPGYGVSDTINHHVYQFTNCHFNDIDETMELVSEYDYHQHIPRNEYYIPTWMSTFPSSDGLFYFSGEIDYVNVASQEGGDFRYGYFEIRCKLPQHKGTFPAFWLHSQSTDTSDPYYEEIDIFEHSRNLLESYPYWPGYVPPPTRDSARVFTTGIYHNLTGLFPNFYTESFVRNFPLVPRSSNDLSDWHTFGCEWMPDHVYWYFDGKLVNSYLDKNHIPRHSMTLKTNYAIDEYAVDHDTHQPIWFGSDEMDIEYIYVYQLEWDCDTDETITCQTDLDDFEYGVKKSVAITSTVGEPIVGSTDKITFRVSDSFEITGPFQVESGAEFTIIRQDCPNND